MTLFLAPFVIVMVGHWYILEPMLMISKYFWNGFYFATYQSWDESEKRNHKSYIAINPFAANYSHRTKEAITWPSDSPHLYLILLQTVPGKENKVNIGYMAAKGLRHKKLVPLAFFSKINLLLIIKIILIVLYNYT